MCVFEQAAAVNTSLRAASEMAAVEGHRQHRAHRRPKPHSHGPERSERPVRQVQARTPEVQKQGIINPQTPTVESLLSVLLRLDLMVYFGDVTCVVVLCADGAKDPESTVEGTVRPPSVRGVRRRVGDHSVGQRHRAERRLHRTVSFCLHAFLEPDRYID